MADKLTAAALKIKLTDEFYEIILIMLKVKLYNKLRIARIYFTTP